MRAQQEGLDRRVELRGLADYLRRSGPRLRISAQLVKVTDGYQLWSDRYDRELEDVFAIQDEIAENIVKALRVVLSDREKRAIEKAPTANVQAYEFYLRGREKRGNWIH